ncbi:MAG TPA: thiamine-phosphate kinase, partial [Gemmatimonadales bacterium]|nr:thiamine-phosphate kinase [Gemmatimonadales bacterium]
IAMLPLGPGPEFDRVRAIARALGPLAAGLGDDCAILPEVSGSNLVLSTDVSVEEVHFRREWLGPAEIGWRAAATALSDLAAAGAEAIGLLAAVTVPRDTREKQLAELMQGVGEAVGSVGGVVLGGDLSGGPAWSLAITVVGRATRPLSRRGAKAGDGVWVTGMLGGARAAVEAWRQGKEPEPEARRAFGRPEPRIAAGRALAARGATALIDLSDGLASDARHLAAASAVELRIELDRLPVAASAGKSAQAAGVSPAEFAARGGEDYELLASLPASFDDAGAQAFLKETGLLLTRIGQVLTGTGTQLLLKGAEVTLTGFDHFG